MGIPRTASPRCLLPWDRAGTLVSCPQKSRSVLICGEAPGQAGLTQHSRFEAGSVVSSGVIIRLQ